MNATDENGELSISDAFNINFHRTDDTCLTVCTTEKYSFPETEALGHYLLHFTAIDNLDGSKAYHDENMDVKCTAGEPYCRNNNVFGCNSDGFDEHLIEACTNTCIDGECVDRALPGDVRIDCRVNIFDLALVGFNYGRTGSGWNPDSDLNGDGKTNIFDLATVGLHYGEDCELILYPEDGNYRQPGDYLPLTLQSTANWPVIFNYPSELQLVSGECRNSQAVPVQRGDTHCQFLIPDNMNGAIPIEVQDDISYYDEHSQADIEVMDATSLIVTSRGKLQSEGTLNFDGAVSLANSEQAVVYDLDKYLEGHPFSGFSSYNEDPLNPIMKDNTYALKTALFIRSKCRDCDNIIIYGDDYVVPHYRVDYNDMEWWWFWQAPKTNYIYTDQAYIPTSEKYFAELDDLFSDKRIVFVLPDTVPQTTRQEVEQLKQLLLDRYRLNNPYLNTIHDITEYRSSGIGCNSRNELGGISLAGGTSLFLLGRRENNNAIKCTPFFKAENGSLSLERNVWSNKNDYAVIVGQEGDEIPDPLITLEQMIRKGPDISWQNGRFLTACLWDGKFEGGNPMLEETVCNIIPIIELAPDIRDSMYCILNWGKTDANELVCTIVHFASAYDFATYAAAIFSFGIVGAVGEIGDVGLAGLKVAVKSAVKDLSDSILKAAKGLMDNEVVHWLARLVAKASKKTDEITKSAIKALGEFGDSGKKALRITGESTAEWAGEAVEGLAKIIDKLGINHYIVKNIDKLKNIDGIDRLTKKIASQLDTDEYAGLAYETVVDAKLLDKGHDVLEISVKGPVTKEFDVLFKESTTAKKVLAEIKSGKPSNWVLEAGKPKSLKDQMMGYKAYANINNIDEVRLISQHSVPSDIKSTIESWGVKVVEEVGL